MSDDKTAVPVSYDYDDEAAGHAEDFANRIDKSDAFIGKFSKVWALKTRIKEDGTGGTEGLHFEFEGGGGETTSFDLYTLGPKGTKKKDGTIRTETEKFVGYNQLMALMLLMGVKTLKPKKGKIEAWEDNKRVEADGDTFPDLCGKTIGLVLQRENYNKQDGKETFRMNFLASFRAEDRMTASEIREKKTKPEKIEKILRSLRNKDSRTVAAAEPAQPSQAVPAGDY